MQLTKAEEELMEIIWRHEKVFMKDLLEHCPPPKPATTTVATLLKRMQDKGFVGYTLFGNSRQYYPLVNKTDYFSQQMKGLIKNFFNNSPLQFASFFTKASNMSQTELEDLKKIVDEQIKKNKS
jgi:BlaI family transcriptional regulator, penicillinase repressor